MIEILEQLISPFGIRAIIASSMVGVMCGAIGSFIVLRNMSMIGDALSHAILPGIVVAFLLIGYNTLGFFIGSVLAGLATAFVITWIQQNVQTKNDAAIGIVFTAMFSIGVIGISHLSRHSEEGVHLDLKDFLFGNVLGVSNEDLVITAIVLVYTLICIYLFYRYLFITTFQPIIAKTMGISVKYVHYFLMLLLSFAVVASLRTVGVILVVAMLITPAATALLLSHRLQKVIVISSLIGLISAILGTIGAFALDTTPGPLMTLVATLIYGIVIIFAPEQGIVAKYRIKRKQYWKILQEDILKQVFKSSDKGATVTSVAEKLNVSIKQIERSIQKASIDKLFIKKGEQLELSYAGQQRANSLVRAHRLWESYQVNTMGIDNQRIHQEAEIQEHKLTDELLDEIEQKLGNPKVDPHGSPIPEKRKLPNRALLSLAARTKGTIAKSQISDKIESELWELGLMPLTTFTLIAKDRKSLRIKQNDRSIRIPNTLAQYINIEE